MALSHNCRKPGIVFFLFFFLGGGGQEATFSTIFPVKNFYFGRANTNFSGFKKVEKQKTNKQNKNKKQQKEKKRAPFKLNGFLSLFFSIFPLFTFFKHFFMPNFPAKSSKISWSKVSSSGGTVPPLPCLLRHYRKHSVKAL